MSSRNRLPGVSGGGLEAAFDHHLTRITNREFFFPGREPQTLPAWCASIRNGTGRVFHQCHNSRGDRLEATSCFVAVSPTKLLLSGEILLENEFFSSRDFPLMFEFPDEDGTFGVLSTYAMYRRGVSLIQRSRERSGTDDAVDGVYWDAKTGLRWWFGALNGRLYVMLELRRVKSSFSSDEVDEEEGGNLLRGLMISTKNQLLFQVPECVFESAELFQPQDRIDFLSWREFLQPPDRIDFRGFGGEGGSFVTATQVGLRSWTEMTFHLVAGEGQFGTARILENSLPVIACGAQGLLEGSSGKRLRKRITDVTAQNLVSLAFPQLMTSKAIERINRRLARLKGVVERCGERHDSLVKQLNLPLSVKPPLLFVFEEKNCFWTLDSWKRHVKDKLESLVPNDDEDSALLLRLTDSFNRFLAGCAEQIEGFHYSRAMMTSVHTVQIEGGLIEDSSEFDTLDCDQIRRVNIFNGDGCAGAALFVSPNCPSSANFPWLVGAMFEMQDYESLVRADSFLTHCVVFTDRFRDLTDPTLPMVDSLAEELTRFFGSSSSGSDLSEYEWRRKIAWENQTSFGRDADDRFSFLTSLFLDLCWLGCRRFRFPDDSEILIPRHLL